MPSIASRTVPRPSGYEAVDIMPAQAVGLPNIDPNLQPNLNVFLRGTLPSIFAAPDNLRQFYNGGLVPQYRVFPASPLKPA